MFVYLDESGDTGFRFEHGSSRYFVLTLLLVDDPIPFQTAVDELRERLGFAPRNEFKFYRSSEEVRWAFLQMLRRQSFTARLLVIDKMLMSEPHMRKRETFYNFLVQMILKHGNGTINDATLILDESVKGKKSKQELATYLRQALNADRNQRKITSVRYHKSHTDNLIQAADMVSGAVYARYHKGDPSYLDSIRSKISDLWEWRPNPR